MYFVTHTAISHTHQPAIISVGRWIHTPTLATDIAIAASTKSHHSKRIGFALVDDNIYAKSTSAIPNDIHTAAWSDGNDIVGKCLSINLCVPSSTVSGLAFSKKN